MARRSQVASDLDSPWKEALERFLEPFLAFFCPHLHALVDWTRGAAALPAD
jgi:hypothetical protein